MRTKLGALLGAGGLILLAASATIAAPPTYSIVVDKTAAPATVPSGGGTVAFTVWVTNNGAGFLQTVNITDSLGGCTLGAKVETTGDGDDKLETGETWSYSCNVTGVTPGTTNTATVHACHNVSACNQAAHDVTGQDSVTVTEGTTPPGTPEPTVLPTAEPTVLPTAEPTVLPTAEPTVLPTAEPTVDPGTDDPGTPGTPDPSQDQAGITQSNTDTANPVVGVVGSQRTLLLVLSLGMLMASLILITPTRPVRARNTER
jgi:uncharacterized repeat protein (TIGR01451 family)